MGWVPTELPWMEHHPARSILGSIRSLTSHLRISPMCRSCATMVITSTVTSTRVKLPSALTTLSRQPNNVCRFVLLHVPISQCAICLLAAADSPSPELESREQKPHAIGVLFPRCGKDSARFPEILERLTISDLCYCRTTLWSHCRAAGPEAS